LEDKEGSFWVLTSEGLDEFDRKTRTVTLHVPFKLAGGQAAGFYEDQQGVLWISYITGNGLAVFDRKSRTLIRYSLNPLEQVSASVTGVSAIVEDQTGALWLATMTNGLFKLDQKRRTLLRYSNNPSDPDSMPSAGVLTLGKDRRGGIWAASVNYGVSHFEPRPPPFEKLPPSGNGEPFVTASQRKEFLHQNLSLFRVREHGVGIHWLIGPGPAQVDAVTVGIAAKAELETRDLPLREGFHRVGFLANTACNSLWTRPER